MSSPSTPPAPDYVGAAQATAQGNLEALQYQTAANRVNQVSPYGSSSWESPDQQYQQALSAWFAGGEHGTAPSQSDYQWTQTTNLNPNEQAALNSQQQIQANQSQLAQNMEGNVASTMSQPFSAPSLSSYMSGVPSVESGYSGFNPSGVPGVNTSAPQFSDATAQHGAQAAYDAQMGLLQPQLDEQKQSTENQLTLQGLTPGTQAYDNAMRDLNNAQSSQIDQIANQSVLTGNQEANQNYASALEGYNAGNAAQAQDYGQALQGYDTGQQAITNANTAQAQSFGEGQTGYQTAYQAALDNYMQPLTAMDAVLNGTSVQNPQFPNYFQQGYAPGTDYSTAANEQGAFNSNVYAADSAAQSNNINAGIGLAGTAIMAIAL